MSQPGDSNNANADLPFLTTTNNDVERTQEQQAPPAAAAAATAQSKNASTNPAEPIGITEARTAPVPAPAAAAVIVGRPESPVNRKRSEVKDDDYDMAHGFGDIERGVSGDMHLLQDAKSSGFPPLKKSKTSPPLPPGNLTEYRSPDLAAEDNLSPQTSPVLEPFAPIATVMNSNNANSAATATINRRGSPPGSTTATLARARTLEEIRNTPPPSFSRHATANLDDGTRANETSIERLNLGTPSERPIVAERAMGVITSRPGSRQTSPEIVTIEMKSPPSAQTPKGLQEYTDNGESSEGDDANLTKDSHMSTPGSEFNTGVASSVEGISSGHSSDDDGVGGEGGDGGPTKNLLDTSVDYNEDEDADYESGLGEQAKEGESESETDLANHSIDVDELQIDSDADVDAESDDYNEELYVDGDPNHLDLFTEEEATVLIEEAREHGIQHMMEKYVFSEGASLKKLFVAFAPNFEIDWTHVTVSDLQDALPVLMVQALRNRRRLENVQTIEKVVDLLKSSKNIMVLTGAGVSVSCGIPDFRSEDGIYSRLSEFQLDDPQQMFDLDFFKERPEIFYSFAREIFPSNFIPSPSHYFIKLLEDRGTLLRNYTQNIDTLEQKAGITNVLQCHGSFATASCLRCGHQVDGNDIKDAIFKQEVAYCKVCTAARQDEKEKKKQKKKKKSSRARYHSSDEDDDDDDEDSDENRPLMKPDIVFFGEKLPKLFDDSLEDDKDKVDLLIVIGSSLKVSPVSDIMARLPARVPQILINRTPIIHMNFDVQLLGNCDTIVAELCRRAGWELVHERLPGGRASAGPKAEYTVVEPNTYLFEGAVMHDVEYHDRLNKGRKRGRLEADEIGDTEGSMEDSSADEEALRRRQYIHVWGSNHSMDEDSNSDDDHSDSSTNTVQEATISAEFTATAITMVATTSSVGESEAKSPAPISAGSLHIPKEGFAVGTTEPHSGNLEDIHRLQSPIVRSGSASSSASSTRLSDKDGGNGGEADRDEDEESARIRVMFTEKMPKDLGEEGDEPPLPSEDMSGYESSGSSHHERRSSLAPSLGPISEDPVHEVDEDQDVLDIVDEEHSSMEDMSKEAADVPSDSAMDAEPTPLPTVMSSSFSVSGGVSSQPLPLATAVGQGVQPGFDISLSQPLPTSGSTTPFEFLSPRLTASQPRHQQQPGFFSPPLSATHQQADSRASPAPPNPSSFEGLGPPANDN